MPDRYPVCVIDSTGGKIQGELETWEESPIHEDSVMLKLHLPDVDIESVADDFFSALLEIRGKLENTGRLLVLYGSSLRVYPSPMSRNMGSGEKAYKLIFGQQAKTADLVSIFDSGPDVEPSTVHDQQRFYEDWLQSLKK